MNIEKLRYFITTARLLSFSKAAKIHYVSQTAISQQIASIENELGVKLFYRSNVKVSLTQEGELFYKECTKIVTQYDQAVSKVKSFHKDKKKTLVIGYSSSLERDILTEWAKIFAKEYPDIHMVFDTRTMAELEQGLVDESLDIIFTMSSAIKDREDIEQLQVYREPMLLGVSKEHPLANRNEVDSIELKDESFLMLSYESSQNVMESMVAHCEEDGYTPNIVEKVMTVETLVLLVELNRGVSFLPNTEHFTSNHKIHFLNVKNSAHCIDIVAAWKHTNTNETVNAFIKILRSSRL